MAKLFAELKTNKKKLFITIFLILASILIYAFFFLSLRDINKMLNTETDEVEIIKKSETESTAMNEDLDLEPKLELEPIVMNEEELVQYYQAYKDPYVIHLRKSIDGYLNGTNYGMDNPDIVYELEMDDGRISGVEPFKEYLESKFIVISIDDGLFGGKIINIMFQDKPDQIFWTWVYKKADGEYDLRGFTNNVNFDETQIKEFQILFKNYLEDKEHAL